MRRLITVLCVMLTCLTIYAQVPHTFNYQAVVRQADGSALPNSNVSFRFSILQTSSTGAAAYVETHAVSTNENGLVNLRIGEGSIVSGDMTSIDWGEDLYFLKVDMDINGGSAYADMSNEQMVAVPFSLFANDAYSADTANHAFDANNALSAVNATTANSATTAGFADSTNSAAFAWSAESVINSDNSITNEIQTLMLVGNDLTLSDGGGTVSVADVGPWEMVGNEIYYSAGDIGIGTSSPNAELEVYGNSSLSHPHILLHENGNDYARMNFQNNNGSNYWSIAAYIASNNKNDRLNFWNGTSGDVMTITGDGEVGIGVGISPKVPFHIGNGRRVLFGIDTLGNGDKLMFLPDLHAFRVGTVATGAASTYWNRDSIGLYSFASGLNTRAQGYGATAMGRDTEATNSYAFATGFFTNADGQYSTAMGFNTDAFALGSTALGYSTDAEESYSFAAGYFAEAQAIYSVAIGNSVRAQSFASMAVGRYNVGGGSATSWLSSDPIFEIGIGTGPSTRANAVTVRKNGNVGIGTTFPGALLHVNGEIRVGSLEEFSDGGSFIMQVNSNFAPLTNGNRNLGNTTYRWNTLYATNGTISTSDAREKNSIKDIRYGLEEIMQLRPVSFRWNEMPEEGTKLGLIAQDVQKVVNEVVSASDWVIDESTGERIEIEADRMGIYYSDLIPVLIKGMQEQQAMIQNQQQQIDRLEAQVNRLKQK